MAQVQETLKVVAVEKLRGALRGALRQAEAAVAEVAKAESDAKEAAERKANGALADELGRLAKTEVGRLAKVTPPDISEATAHKIKREYKGDKSKAYATMWSIHNKRTEKSEDEKALKGAGHGSALAREHKTGSYEKEYKPSPRPLDFNKMPREVAKSVPVGVGLARAMRLSLAAGKKPQAAAPAAPPAGNTPPPVKKDEAMRDAVMSEPMAKAATPPRPHTKEGLALAGAAIPPPHPGAAPAKLPGLTAAAGAGRPGGYKLPGMKPKAGPPPVPAAAGVGGANKQIGGMKSIAANPVHAAAMGKAEGGTKVKMHCPFCKADWHYTTGSGAHPMAHKRPDGSPCKRGQTAMSQVGIGPSDSSEKKTEKSEGACKGCSKPLAKCMGK